MSRKRIFELLDLVAEAAKDDRAAGRLIWAAQQEELVQLTRRLLRDRKPGAKKGSPTPWREGQKTKYDEPGGSLR